MRDKEEEEEDDDNTLALSCNGDWPCLKHALDLQVLKGRSIYLPTLVTLHANY